MAVLYIKEQGALVQKRSERILITKNRQTLLEIPFAHVENIAVIGNVQITAQALQAFLTQGINISYFSFSGKYLGSTSSEESRNIFLRLAQYEMYQKTEERLKVARKIVANKIENQIAMIKGYRWENSSQQWKNEITQLEKLKQKAEEAQKANELLGLEGKASNVYFQAYGRMFKCKFVFSGRNRRPPRDPINVIISLGYTFLTKEVSSALEAESFEMYLGFLHGIRYGRKSLPLDIVEEFRQPVVDRMTLKLFNKRMIQEFDFGFEDDRVLLNEEGFRKFCQEFERRMTTENDSGVSLNYRSIIQRQAKNLKKAIQEKGGYQPFCQKESSSI